MTNFLNFINPSSVFRRMAMLPQQGPHEQIKNIDPTILDLQEIGFLQSFIFQKAAGQRGAAENRIIECVIVAAIAPAKCLRWFAGISLHGEVEIGISRIVGKDVAKGFKRLRWVLVGEDKRLQRQKKR